MTEISIHGGDLAAIAKRYGCDAASLLDFSVNINPAGPPEAVLQAVRNAVDRVGALAPYPDPTATPLREALGARLAIDPDAIVVSNGAAAAIDAVVRALSPARCLLPVPAFSEYARALRAGGAEYVPHELGARWELDVPALLRHAYAARAGMLVLTNPHNPTGTLIPKGAVEELIAGCKSLATAVVIDEAFIDYAPNESILRGALRHEHVIVIRSMTKFYGMAGIRVGYAVAQAGLAQHIRAMLPSWPVGTIAIAAAVAALSDRDYERSSLRDNAIERERLAGHLRILGITVFPSAANFLLLELPIPPTAMDELIENLVVKHHIVVRDCRTYETLANRSLIRVAVKTRNENKRLTDALENGLGTFRALHSSTGSSFDCALRARSG